MEDISIFRQILEGCMSILQCKFTIFGYSISLWNVFAYTAIVGIIARTVWEVIDPD